MTVMTDKDEATIRDLIAPWQEYVDKLQGRIAEKDVQITELNRYIIQHEIAIGARH